MKLAHYIALFPKIELNKLPLAPALPATAKLPTSGHPTMFWTNYPDTPDKTKWWTTVIDGVVHRQTHVINFS